MNLDLYIFAILDRNNNINGDKVVPYQKVLTIYTKQSSHLFI